MPDSRRKSGLRVPQVRILDVLSVARGGLTRPEISRLARVSLSMTGNLGPVYEEDIEEAEARYGKRSLYGLGYVRAEQQEGEEVRYHITTRGRKGLAAYKAAIREREMSGTHHILRDQDG